MQRLIRAAEIARGKTLNGTSPVRRARAGVALEVASAEREVDVRERTRRLADQRLHPVAAELVAVAVEEHVGLLLDRMRREEVRVGAPEHGLGAPSAELEQALEAALRVRDDQVVLARIGSVVVVEPGIHAAELRQAHRHVAVVEDDRDAEPVADRLGDAAKVRHRDREDEHRVGPLALDEPQQMPTPARRDDTQDRLAGQPVDQGLLGAVLGATEVPVALESREEIPRARVGLAFEVGRVRRRAPPGGLDGRPRYGVTTRSTPSSCNPFQSCHQAGVQP